VFRPAEPVSAPAQLVLEDGTTFAGRALAFPKPVCGEVVFNTGMVGYTEALTDPSYSGQATGTSAAMALLIAFFVTGLAGGSLRPEQDSPYLWIAIGCMYGMLARTAR
jgi:hypothetical protein